MIVQGIHQPQLTSARPPVRPFCCSRSRQPRAIRCTAQPAQQQDTGCGRRDLLTAAAFALVASQAPSPARAYTLVPEGKRRHVDVLDGYSFLYPEYWSAVTTSGNDTFYRNPYNVEENLFVNITSPSSSTFDSVKSLGSAEQAGQRLRQQYLSEFMSTRLGSRKTADIMSAASRTGDDGRLYYDIEIRAQSFASRSPLAQTQTEVDANMVREWERRLLFTLGVAGSRLYELRLQTKEDDFQTAQDELREITRSFRCYEVEQR